MLIGESYVHGIMNGEALDDADFEIQEFRLGRDLIVFISSESDESADYITESV